MTAPAHLLLTALTDPDLTAAALPKPSAEPDPDRLGPPAAPHLDVYATQGAEAPLTSEPPLPDAEPLTSEPPLAETAPLTSESAPLTDGSAAESDPSGAEV
ncbi:MULTISPECIES: hypothetical protein [Streptomyces]|uniref:hypothetical protein n=1 Tax=Streptomyces TaxID=1883 RepID=UPI0013AC954C|nr:hypothetical protein [Streptomyces sennicomposti]MYS47133.1 hypothetical protein [Streptomyces sp. SID5998]MYX46107.1 hypothetical protein [Streptomyces sp. SID89]